MAQNQGLLLVCEDADRVNINRVLEALGRGPESITRKLTEADPATPSSTVSHWFAFDAASYAAFQSWAALATALPNNNDSGSPIVWTDWGFANKGQAVAAMQSLEVFACDTNLEPVVYAASVFAAMGLRIVPDPEP